MQGPPETCRHSFFHAWKGLSFALELIFALALLLLLATLLTSVSSSSDTAFVRRL